MVVTVINSSLAITVPSLVVTDESLVTIWKLGRTVCVHSMVRYLCTGLKIQDSRKEKSRVQSLKEQSQTLGLRLMYICNITQQPTGPYKLAVLLLED